MNAPLSLYLTHFSAPTPSPAEIAAMTDDLPAFEPDIRMSAEELASQIADAVAAARAEAEIAHEATIAAMRAEQETAMAEALAAARAEWAQAAGEELARRFDGAMAQLREQLAERVAAVLRPLLTDAVRTRVQDELCDAVDRLVADPTQPLLRIQGPADMEAALRAARPTAAFEWTAAESLEIEIAADATRVETKLAAALAALAATES